MLKIINLPVLINNASTKRYNYMPHARRKPGHEWCNVYRLDELKGARLPPSQGIDLTVSTVHSYRKNHLYKVSHLSEGSAFDFYKVLKDSCPTDVATVNERHVGAPQGMTTRYGSVVVTFD
tara:strand:- start:2502 stop:2864 length:363 start_codon:yes stop_codon:yes gene_type:complete